MDARGRNLRGRSHNRPGSSSFDANSASPRKSSGLDSAEGSGLNNIMIHPPKTPKAKRGRIEEEKNSDDFVESCLICFEDIIHQPHLMCNK